MLVPNKTKYRKIQKCGKKITGISRSGFTLCYGSYGLKALNSGRLTSRQIEAARKVMTRTMKRSGKLWIKVFPHTPITKKPAEVRMGSGKGNVEFWIFKVKPGRILFELDGVSEEVAIEALNKAAAKLPFKTKTVKVI